MMKEAILHIDASKEFATTERCFILELSNTSNDPEVSIARARVARGITTCWHRLRGTTERYVILEGSGEVEIGSLSPRQVETGDIAVIPPLCRQRIRNTGEQDLVFLAICSPRFKQENYEDMEAGPAQMRPK